MTPHRQTLHSPPGCLGLFSTNSHVQHVYVYIYVCVCICTGYVLQDVWGYFLQTVMYNMYICTGYVLQDVWGYFLQTVMYNMYICTGYVLQDVWGYFLQTVMYNMYIYIYMCVYVYVLGMYCKMFGVIFYKQSCITCIYVLGMYCKMFGVIFYKQSCITCICIYIYVCMYMYWVCTARCLGLFSTNSHV